jgi:hypothetical protein
MTQKEHDIYRIIKTQEWFVGKEFDDVHLSFIIYKMIFHPNRVIFYGRRTAGESNYHYRARIVLRKLIQIYFGYKKFDVIITKYETY